MLPAPVWLFDALSRDKPRSRQLPPPPPAPWHIRYAWAIVAGLVGLAGAAIILLVLP